MTTPRIQIKAAATRTGGGGSVSNADTAGTFITAEDNDEIKMTAGPDPATEKLTVSGWTYKGVPKPEWNGNLTPTVIFGTDTSGLYEVTGKVGDQDGVTAKIELRAAAATSEPPPAPPSQVVEVSVGELDKTFLYASLIAAGVLILVVLLIVAVILGSIHVPKQVPLTEKQHVDGTYTEGIAGRVLALAAGVGGILLVVGGWLGALETRGRLKTTTTVTTHPSGGEANEVARRGLAATVSEVVTKLPEAIKQLSLVRATIAVLFFGCVVLVSAVFGSVSLAGGSQQPAAPAPTPTPSVTSAPAVPGATDTSTASTDTPTTGANKNTTPNPAGTSG